MIRIAAIALLISLSVGIGCKSDDPFLDGDCFIPNIGVNQTINMDLPEFFNLQNLGEFIELDAGNRGIFLVHNFDDLFYAVEQTCTFNSDDECSSIVVDATSQQLRCGTDADTGFVECCASRFLFDGRVVNGPARCNLKTYIINRSGNTLFINN